MRVQDNCKGGGGPVLVSALAEDNGNNDSNGNNDGNGGVGPLLATDARRDNNENGDVHGEGNCGSGGSGDGGGDNDDDDDDEGGGDNNNNSSDNDNNGGGDNNEDNSDGDDNGGNGGDGSGGCNTATAEGTDTYNNQLKAAIDNRRGRPRVCPWIPCCNFLVSFLLLHFAKIVLWEQRSLTVNSPPPPKELVARFNLDSYTYLHTSCVLARK
jgi:hypothetical protein